MLFGVGWIWPGSSSNLHPFLERKIPRVRQEAASRDWKLGAGALHHGLFLQSGIRAMKAQLSDSRSASGGNFGQPALSQRTWAWPRVRRVGRKPLKEFPAQLGNWQKAGNDQGLSTRCDHAVLPGPAIVTFRVTSVGRMVFLAKLLCRVLSRNAKQWRRSYHSPL